MNSVQEKAWTFRFHLLCLPGVVMSPGQTRRTASYHGHQLTAANQQSRTTPRSPPVHHHEMRSFLTAAKILETSDW